jgi:LPS export ABC transporter protein LptC
MLLSSSTFKSRISIVLLCLCMWACQKNTTMETIKPYNGPMIEVNKVETLYTDSSTLRIKLTAPKEYEFQNGDREFPEGEKIEFYDENGVPSSVLTSNYGKFDKEKNIYIVKNNVVVKNLVENKKLSTSELYWNPLTEKVYTDKFVVIETPEQILKGDGLTANQQMSTYKILNPHGVFLK